MSAGILRATFAWLAALMAIVAALAGGTLLAVPAPADDGATGGVMGLVFLVAMALPGIAYPLVGALVVSRRPSNVMGTIFLVIGLAWSIMVLALALTEHQSGSAVGASLLLQVLPWIGSWVWSIPTGLAFMFVPLLFPNGRLLSRRWRPIAALSGVALTLQSVAQALAPGPLGANEKLDNPFAIHGPAGELARLFGTDGLGMLSFAMLTVVAVSSLVIRFRRSRGMERQQIKWIAYTVAVTAALFLLFVVAMFARAAEIAPLPAFVTDFLQMLVIYGFASVPVAAGIAILRYRLYDIDILIRRTLVYGMLSVTLAAVYWGSVIVLQGLLSRFVGADTLAVAVSTLAVAVLFQPARWRIKTAVDRRFYRSRYDAKQTVEGFSARLRNEVDITLVTSDLTDVVADSLQPSSVSVWLRREATP